MVAVRVMSEVRVVHMAQFFFSTKENYTVSQKTTLMLHNITSTHINRFWQFLTDMLLREYTVCFTTSPYYCFRLSLTHRGPSGRAVAEILFSPVTANFDP